MATARKLKSGSWRCLVFDGKDENGQRIYKSFTGPTKKEAEYQAAAYKMEHRDRVKEKITLREAMQKYCEMKSNVLSPSTLKEYWRSIDRDYSGLADLHLSSIDSKKVQIWINSMTGKVSEKTIRNRYGFLYVVLKTFQPHLRSSVTLPQRQKPVLYVPTDDDVRTLLAHLAGRDPELEKAVYLAAYGTLRRSEICALTAANVSGNVLQVHGAMVSGSDRQWHRKTTKTTSSTREVEMPDFVIAKLPDAGPLVNLNPDQVTRRFERALKRLELPHFRFHDLRHYAASMMHAIGIPDVYIMERGGWSSDGTLKRIYRNSMDDYRRKFTDKMFGHFEIMQHEMQHEEKKST